MQQMPGSIVQDIETQSVFIVILNCKVGGRPLLSPRSPKFAIQQVTLAPFTLLILTLCRLGHTSKFSASCCINIEWCSPVFVRNFIVDRNQLESECMGHYGVCIDRIPFAGFQSCLT